MLTSFFPPFTHPVAAQEAKTDEKNVNVKVSVIVDKVRLISLTL